MSRTAVTEVISRPSSAHHRYRPKESSPLSISTVIVNWPEAGPSTAAWGVPSDSLGSSEADQSSDPVSSPIASSFGQGGSGSSGRTPGSTKREYKSKASSRTAFAGALGGGGSASLSDKLRAQTLTNARLARQSTRNFAVEHDPDYNPFESGDFSPGGLRGGHWEELTEEEEELLGRVVAREAAKQRRSQERQYEAQLSDGVVPLEEEIEEPEPPSDVWGDEVDQLEDPDRFANESEETLRRFGAAPMVPDLASAGTMSSDWAEGDSEMVLDEDDEGDISLPPSSPPPMDGGQGHHFSDAEDAFVAALSNQPCPKCRHEGLFSAPQSEGVGLVCLQCQWTYSPLSVETLYSTFMDSSHIPPQVMSAEATHKPLFSYTEYTGTSVFCSGCEESF